MIRQVLKFAITCSITQRILLICLLNSFCQSSSSPPAGFLKGVSMLLPMYPLSPSQLRGPSERSTPDSPRQWLSWRLPGIGSETHAGHPVMVQATCTFIPVVLRFPEYSSGCALHDQHGSSVPSTM